MARTERMQQQGTRKASRSATNSRGSPSSSSSRQSQISRSLSKLLRHQAENERVPISPAGWVRVDNLLKWRGLERIGKGITMGEIFDVVEEDGRVGKGRFGVRYVGDDIGDGGGVGDSDSDDGNGGAEEEEREETEAEEQSATNEEKSIKGSLDVDGATTGDMVGLASRLAIDQESSIMQQPEQSQQPMTAVATLSTDSSPIDPASKNTPETQRALHHYSLNPRTDPSAYLIRATQGHSIKSVASTDLLAPITLSTLSEPSNRIPATVVHGTFYGAWSSILATGGLKPMSRNNVHFATGPSLDEVLGLIGLDANDDDGNDGGRSPAAGSGGSGGSGVLKHKSQVDQVLSRNKVISGMRWDAQILIFVDLKRCLEDAASAKIQMDWFVSGNGVVLTEGCCSSRRGADNDGTDGSTNQTLVPTEYFAAAVEIKHGVGMLWRHGQGEVSVLPDRLRNMPMPRGKIQTQSRSHGKGSRGPGPVSGSGSGGGDVGDGDSRQRGERRHQTARDRDRDGQRKEKKKQQQQQHAGRRMEVETEEEKGEQLVDD